MAVDPRYQPDVEVILSHRGDNGGELWATPDGRLLKGAPFSTLESALLLLELGTDPDDPVLRGVAELFFAAWREDGRFKLYPSGAIYPCHTAHAAELLCKLGHAADPRLQATFEHFLATPFKDGGWRCNKSTFGPGPENDYSNPLPTLVALSAFRHSQYLNREPKLDAAVEFLLRHWTVKKPLGPCRYGIGTLFMQVEYPFRGYNLFNYCHILSFYDRAKEDTRFLEAVEALTARTVDGHIVPQRVVPKLAKLEFCKKGRPSELGTLRYKEILRNLGRA